jgi:hypothetical protein
MVASNGLENRVKVVPVPLSVNFNHQANNFCCRSMHKASMLSNNKRAGI